jgi:elongation factor P--beta-lysine ligase
MMKKVSGGYKIEISEKELLRSMRFIKDLRDFFREQKSEEIAQAASLMQTAIEAMIFVYSEEFGGDICES